MNQALHSRAYDAFLRFENACISDAIRNAPDEMDRARLIIRTCVLAGSAAYLLIVIALLLTPSMWRSYIIIAIGQTTLIASAGLLKTSKDTTWPTRAFAVIGVLHLVISCGVSGGVRSPLLSAFSIMPIYLGFLGGKRLAIHATCGLLGGGALLMFWDMHAAFSLPFVYSAPLTMSVLAWSLATLATIFIYAQVVYNDLLDQLEAERERLQQVNASKDLFLAYMSHEIRNPLTSIVGATDLLALDPQASKNKYLKSLREATINLNHLVSRVLDFSRLETDAVELSSKPIAVQELCETIIRHELPGAHAKGLNLDYEIHPNTSNAVMSDPDKLKQVLTNLLNNSMKFTNTGNIRLIFKPIDNGERTLVSVTDTGIGIPADELSAVFEPYRQARRIDGNQSGTGLGLAICQALVRQMGSELEVESQVDKGSTFSFSLQAAAIPDSARAVYPGPDDLLDQLPSGLNGLVVDDNHSAAAVLEGILQSLGCTVNVAHSGSQALEVIQNQTTDFILLDMQMPEMDGTATATKIRSLENQLSLPPAGIVIVTGNVAPELADKSPAIDAVLSKPVNRQDLVGAIRASIKQSN